jgi:hypothetical protein
VVPRQAVSIAATTPRKVRTMLRAITLSMLYFASLGVFIAAYGLVPQG